jgi:diguanylate cyclase (GGDEF)-like protein
MNNNNNIKNCEYSGFKFIKELTEVTEQNKTLEEILHFVNINFDFVFGAAAIMFLSIKNNKEIKLISSRGIAHEYAVKIQSDTNGNYAEHLIGMFNNNKSFYVNLNDDSSESNYIKTIDFEHKNIKELYAYRFTSEYDKKNVSTIAVIYSVQGFKNSADCTDVDKKNTFDIIFSILSYIITIKKFDEEISECSKFDSISGLYNFKYFHQRLFEETLKANSEHGIMSITLMSINKLNEFNSISGHKAGDTVIGFIGSLIQKHIRTYDVAARYGNKIIICFPNLNKTDAKKIISAIFLEAQDYFIKQNNSIISMNAGIAQYPDDGATERITIDLAESRRFEARRNSKWNII